MCRSRGPARYPDRLLHPRRSLELGQGFGQRLARQHPRSRRRVVDERREHGGSLHQIARLEMIVDVEHRVMRARFVVEGILDELEARETHGVEGDMIGLAGWGDAEGRDAEVAE